MEKLSLKQLGNQVREGIVQDHGSSVRGPGVRYWEFLLSHATSESGKLARERELSTLSLHSDH